MGGGLTELATLDWNLQSPRLEEGQSTHMSSSQS